mmetsp:Transcript_13399/g.42102  ORF Transcript_13399/g.42102 Transcript_13399/m.42102 type:complete len:325 (+) Transcript_13399:240-1214(+)
MLPQVGASPLWEGLCQPGRTWPGDPLASRGDQGIVDPADPGLLLGLVIADHEVRPPGQGNTEASALQYLCIRRVDTQHGPGVHGLCCFGMAAVLEGHEVLRHEHQPTPPPAPQEAAALPNPALKEAAWVGNAALPATTAGCAVRPPVVRGAGRDTVGIKDLLILALRASAIVAALGHRLCRLLLRLFRLQSVAGLLRQRMAIDRVRRSEMRCTSGQRAAVHGARLPGRGLGLLVLPQMLQAGLAALGEQLAALRLAVTRPAVALPKFPHHETLKQGRVFLVVRRTPRPERAQLLQHRLNGVARFPQVQPTGVLAVDLQLHCVEH